MTNYSASRAGNEFYKFERNCKGELTVMTPVGGSGAVNEDYVSTSLSMWNRSFGNGITFSPSGGFCLADGSCLSPDAAWISAEIYQALTPAERRTFPPLCPWFLIELRSQSDSRPELEAKMDRWMENGAKLAWLIDPLERSVSVYKAGEAVEVLEGPDEVRGHGPVDGFVLDLRPVWDND